MMNILLIKDSNVVDIVKTQEDVLNTNIEFDTVVHDESERFALKDVYLLELFNEYNNIDYTKKMPLKVTSDKLKSALTHFDVYNLVVLYIDALDEPKKTEILNIWNTSEDFYNYKHCKDSKSILSAVGLSEEEMENLYMYASEL